MGFVFSKGEGVILCLYTINKKNSMPRSKQKLGTGAELKPTIKARDLSCISGHMG